MVSSNPRGNVLDSFNVPETYNGYKLDSLLAYNTPRFVSIEDRRLGCLYYILVLMVALWVVGFQIVYGNEHYKLFDVTGESRMTIQQPTKKGCNPRKPDCEDAITARSDLPYCAVYKGSSEKKLNHSSNCVYADMVELVPEGPQAGTLFVPSRIDTIKQERGCPGVTGHCSKLWKSAESKNKTYVAGIEDYTLKIVSSYLRKGIHGHSFQHTGYYYECRSASGKVVKTDPCEGTLTMQEIKCFPSDAKCAAARGAKPSTWRRPGRPPLNLNGLVEVADQAHRPKPRAGRHNSSVDSLLQVDEASTSDQSENSEGVFAIRGGDIFTMNKLLELAGLDLDSSMGSEGTPLRERGTAITVNIEYTNLWPGGMFLEKPQVGYVYRVVEQPIDEVKEEIYAKLQPRNANQRIILNRHGVHLAAKVTGSFGVFDPVYLLIMLTTSLALLGAARTCVDSVALYLPSRHQQDYYDAKFVSVKLHNTPMPTHES